MKALKPQILSAYLRTVYKSPHQIVNDYVYIVVERWFSYKKVSKEKVKVVQIAKEEDIEDIPDDKITHIVKCWLKTFLKYC